MNKVMLIGNVGKDPEVRYIDNGICTAKVALATNTPGYTLPNGTQVTTRWQKKKRKQKRLRGGRGKVKKHQ